LLQCQRVGEKVWSRMPSTLWYYVTRSLSAIHPFTCLFSDQTSTSWFPKISSHLLSQ
jgi:hypothetical protein